MKKLIYLLPVMLLFTACMAIKVADVARLTPGMTQREVNQIMGKPVRILSFSDTPQGVVKVFEYRSFRNESYAVEFLNGRLVRYDFMRENERTSVYPVRPFPPRPSVAPRSADTPQ